MPLKGMRELQRRLDAVAHAMEPIGEDWAERTVDEYSNRVRRNTGRLARSFSGESNDNEARVTAHYTAKFEDAGARSHPIKAKPGKRLRFEKRGQAVYVQKVRHPGMRGTDFIDDGASDALDDVPMADIAVRLWNGAA